jgi:hypothetical protein
MANGPYKPSQVLLIRHGEKLGDATDDESGGHNLSVEGSARAAALPALFAPAGSELDCNIDAGSSSFQASYGTQPLNGPAPRFGTPDFIFATADSKHSYRPRETATPTAMTLAVPFDATSYSNSDHDIEKLAADITSKKQYEGKVVLVCWHHGSMGKLAQQFGVANPPPWHGTVFDRVWVIDFSQSPLSVQDQPQMLLFNDSQT